MFVQDDEDQTTSVEELEKHIEKLTKVSAPRQVKVLLLLLSLLLLLVGF